MFDSVLNMPLIALTICKQGVNKIKYSLYINNIASHWAALSYKPVHIKYYSKLSLASLGDYAPANEGTFSPLTDNEFPVIYKIQDVS